MWSEVRAINVIRQALYQRLVADTTLTGMLSMPTAVFHGIAPQSAAFPMLIIQAMSGTPIWQFKGASIETDVWMIRAVNRGTSASTCEDIDARAALVLNDAVLVVSGRDHLAIYRESGPQPYPEVEAGETYWHCLSTYRVVTEP